MNTFGSDLSKVLSAREQAHAVEGLPADVPVIKADTIKKAGQEEIEQEETGQGETEQEETDKKESEV